MCAWVPSSGSGIAGGQISPVTTVANAVSESRTSMTLLRLLMCCVRMSSSLFAFERYAINSVQESQARIDRLQPGASRQSHVSRHEDHGARGDGPDPSGYGNNVRGAGSSELSASLNRPQGLTLQTRSGGTGPAARTVRCRSAASAG